MNENKINQKMELFIEIKEVIEQSRNKVATIVNSELSMLYWQIGKRLRNEVLNNNRADYGKQIVENLSIDLQTEYGSGWSKRHLLYCIKFVEVFPEIEIVNALRSQLSWTHFRIILSVDDELKRNFYIEMCKIEKWSTRTLENRINSMLYERTAISKNPKETIADELELLRNENKISPDLVFRDPYFLDFLGLKILIQKKI